MILIGSIYAGNVVEQHQFRSDAGVLAGYNWLSIWIIPVGLAAVVLLFKDKRKQAQA